MADQTLQQSKGYENNQLQWGITERVFEIKPENRSEDMDYWFWKVKLTASTQLRGIRFRGIRTTQDIGDSVKGKMFEDTLLDWDIWYDNVDRKIKIYSTDYNDFSHIPQYWNDPLYDKWSYVLYNWMLYIALDNADYTQIPWVDPVRTLVISYWSILPMWNSSAMYYTWFSSFPIPSWRNNLITLPIDYQWVRYSNDSFWNWWMLTTPSSWFYLINTREQRGNRPWWIDIASRITRRYLNTNIPIPAIQTEVLSLDNNYTPTISATSSWWIITTINQWNIAKDTTTNTWIWYLNKWDEIYVELRHNHTLNTIDIDGDFLQITRLF